MTEYELRRAAAAAEQREQDRQAQERRDYQRWRDAQRQAQRAERLAGSAPPCTPRSAPTSSRRWAADPPSLATTS